MEYKIILCYSDIFDRRNRPENAVATLKAIPTKNLLAFFCFINSNLHIDAYDRKEQFRMLKMLLDVQPELMIPVGRAIKEQMKVNSALLVFDIAATLKNICLLLKECDIVDTGAPITAEEMKAVFMSTIITNEDYNSPAGTQSQPTDTELSTFCEYMWPNMVKSASHRFRGNIFVHSFKSAAFMRFLEGNPKMSKHFKNYFGMPEDTDLIKFSNNLLNVYVQLALNKKTRKVNYGMNFQLDENPALAKFTLDVSNYNKNQFISTDFKTLRSYPLLKINPDKFLVANWNFLLDKMSSAVIFDLFNNTGLKDEYKDSKGKPSFNKYKAELGYDYSERLFQRVLIETIVKPLDIHLVGSPDGEDNQDFYLRRKKRIGLFEYKDILMVKDGTFASNKEHYLNIKDQLDQNLSGDKGIGQLKKLIIKLAKDFNVFEKDLSGKLNPKQAVIYPILVVTEPLYTIPGMGLYLNEQFKDSLKAEKLPFYVKPLVLVELDFFIEHYDSLKSGRGDFFKLIEYYYSRVLKYKLRKNVKISTNEYLLKFNNFREHVDKTMPFPNHFTKIKKPGTFANMTARNLKLKTKNDDIE